MLITLLPSMVLNILYFKFDEIKNYRTQQRLTFKHLSESALMVCCPTHNCAEFLLIIVYFFLNISLEFFYNFYVQ